MIKEFLSCAKFLEMMFLYSISSKNAVPFLRKVFILIHLILMTPHVIQVESMSLMP